MEEALIRSIYNDVIRKIKIKYGLDLGYMKCKISDMPEHTDGTSAPEYVGKSAGCRTNKGYIVLSPNPEKVRAFYGEKHPEKNLEEFEFKLIAHELAHEIYATFKPEALVNRYIEDAYNSHFKTNYLTKGKYNGDKLREELFAEYFADVLWRHNTDYEYGKFYFYHLVPDDADLSKGLITPAYAYNTGDMDLFNKMTDKYRDRICNQWNIFPDKDPGMLSPEEIIYAINKFRESNYGVYTIYLFRYPPYKELGINMARCLKNKRIVRVNIDANDVISQTRDIYWGHKNSNTKNDELSRTYYELISKEDYFKSYDDNAKMIFARINHIGLVTKNGRLRPGSFEMV